MTTAQLLASAWAWEPTVLAGCALLLAGYTATVRPLAGRALYFVAGVLVLLLSLVSPIDVLGDDYLFSAHMLQHLLMMLVVPPLCLLGLPRQLIARWRRWPVAARLLDLMERPWVAWWPLAVAMWLWHLPLLYDAALRIEPLHVVEHLTFLGTATLYWWPVVSPGRDEPAMAIWGTSIYIFIGMALSSILGIVLAFAPPGLYVPYSHPADELGVLQLIRDGWGLSAADDQQLGGLLMWIPGGALYSVALLAAWVRWLSSGDQEAEPAAPRGQSQGA
ncbi:MAG: cytochrome c oxidase assembly protein [Chloroflexota bacterium]|nr:cytochrome c oxidase assembly protein [Chloroflexota bacterium]